MNRTSIAELLAQGRDALRHSQIPQAFGDALLLLAHVSGLPKAKLLAAAPTDGPLQEAGQYEAYWALIERRKQAEPMAYLLGYKEFMGLRFAVNPHVLIPRPDTELLVTDALAICKEWTHKPIHVLDLCCGSGCVGISLAHYAPTCRVVLADISPDALEVAGHNALALSVAERVCLLQSDLFEQLPQSSRFDCIVANPPYIPSRDIPGLMPDVRVYEPVLALDGGTDGLLFYRSLTKSSGDYLVPGGYLGVEIGYDQCTAVQALFEENGFTDITIHKDLAGHNRVVWGRKQMEDEHV